MQPLRQFLSVLASCAGPEHYLFSLSDLRSAQPDGTDAAFRVLVSRAEHEGSIKRLCRDLYLYDRTDYPRDRVLYHAAARLRAHCFNYISLETALSDSGLISQISFNWITLMSSGRSSIRECEGFGTIEFVHTKRTPAQVSGLLLYDMPCRLWRASPELALDDMRYTRRSLDLVTKEPRDESF